MSLYFIALVLPEELNKQIKDLKFEMAEKFSAKHALKLPAHITLRPPFNMEEEQEKKLSALLQGLAREQNKIPVDLDGFGSFAPRVIYINIKNGQLLYELHGQLEKKLINVTGNKKKVNSQFHPHITIATRDLDQKKFPDALLTFKERKFERNFEAEKITLLKHNGQVWEIHSEYSFHE